MQHRYMLLVCFFTFSHGLKSSDRKLKFRQVITDKILEIISKSELSREQVRLENECGLSPIWKRSTRLDNSSIVVDTFSFEQSAPFLTVKKHEETVLTFSPIPKNSPRKSTLVDNSSIEVDKFSIEVEKFSFEQSAPFLKTKNPEESVLTFSPIPKNSLVSFNNSYKKDKKTADSQTIAQAKEYCRYFYR